MSGGIKVSNDQRLHPSPKDLLESLDKGPRHAESTDAELLDEVLRDLLPPTEEAKRLMDKLKELPFNSRDRGNNNHDSLGAFEGDPQLGGIRFKDINVLKEYLKIKLRNPGPSRPYPGQKRTLKN